MTSTQIALPTITDLPATALGRIAGCLRSCDQGALAGTCKTLQKKLADAAMPPQGMTEAVRSWVAGRFHDWRYLTTHYATVDFTEVFRGAYAAHKIWLQAGARGPVSGIALMNMLVERVPQHIAWDDLGVEILEDLMTNYDKICLELAADGWLTNWQRLVEVACAGHKYLLIESLRLDYYGDKPEVQARLNQAFDNDLDLAGEYSYWRQCYRDD